MEGGKGITIAGIHKMKAIKYIGWLAQIVAVFVIARAVAHPTNMQSLVLQLALGILLSAVGFHISCLGQRLEFQRFFADREQRQKDSGKV